MFDVKKALVVGFLVFIAWLASSVVASFINGIIFAFIPFSGGLALAGTIISFLVFAMLLGVAVVWLLSKFAWVKRSSGPILPQWSIVKAMKSTSMMWMP